MADAFYSINSCEQAAVTTGLPIQTCSQGITATLLESLADLKPSTAIPCQIKEAGVVFLNVVSFQGTVTEFVTKVKYTLVMQFSRTSVKGSVLKVLRHWSVLLPDFVVLLLWHLALWGSRPVWFLIDFKNSINEYTCLMAAYKWNCFLSPGKLSQECLQFFQLQVLQGIF